MLSHSQNILEKLTGNAFEKDVDVIQLQQLATEHPYFGAAQFLLAKKLFESNEEQYEKAIQKTALHFNNTLWLNAIFFNDDANNDQPIKAIIEQPFIANISVEEDDDEESAVDETAEINKDVKQPANIIINEKLSNLLKEQAAEFEKPVEELEPLPEENTPYHRIDYFDSQGIKLDLDKQPDDKLGHRLRRFTDWLKEMKSINPALTNVQGDEAGEIRVKNLAENSNEPKEVLTEAMAEVLLKQGKPEQAIQIYEKLSFSNPAKSVYFAAKIQELKD